MLIRRKRTTRASQHISQHIDACPSHTHASQAWLEMAMDLIEETTVLPSKHIFKMKLGCGSPRRQELHCGSSENKGVPGNSI